LNRHRSYTQVRKKSYKIFTMPRNTNQLPLFFDISHRSKGAETSLWSGWKT
jgi:hypothetical protein